MVIFFHKKVEVKLKKNVKTLVTSVAFEIKKICHLLTSLIKILTKLSL